MNFSKKDSGKKIKYRSCVGLNSTPAERILDISRRSAHYSLKCKAIAAKSMRVNQRLNMLSLALSISITASLLLFQSALLSNQAIIWFTIAGSTLLALISAVQKNSLDPVASSKLLDISTEFNDITHKADQLEFLLRNKKIDEEEALNKHRDLSKQYDALRNKYISNLKGYHFTNAGAGKIDIEGAILDR